MNDSTHRLALLSLIIVSLALFSHIATASVVSSASGSPTLENAGVTPENKQPTSLSCGVNNPEPAAGENITFSGYLGTAEENLAGENITLYMLFSIDDVSLGSTTTDENGYFTLSLEAPSQGIFYYRARFLGNDYYENSESLGLYSSTLDKSLIFGGYAGILIAIVGIGMFLLRRGIARTHYLMPVLIGFALSFFLIFIIDAGILLSILAAGAITGYLFAKKAPQLTKHLRIGCITGLLFLLTLGLILAYSIVTWSPEDLGVIYSITQAEIFTYLFNWAIFSLVYYLLFVGVGAVLGGMLRKLLKPGEQKPPIGSGEATSSGVEQPQETALPSRQLGDR